jgi:hypothetical protein
MRGGQIRNVGLNNFERLCFASKTVSTPGKRLVFARRGGGDAAWLGDA